MCHGHRVKKFVTSFISVPKHVKGLGRQYIPILSKSAVNFSVHPPLGSFRGYDLNKTTILTQNDIVRNIVNDLLMLDNPCFLGNLGSNERLLNPHEVLDAIEDLGYVVGFMTPFDLLKIHKPYETIYFCRENPYTEITKLTRKDERIFTWRLEIT